MPRNPSRNPDQQARAVVAAQASPQQADPDQRLVLVGKEIDNRLAILQVSAAAGIRPDRLKSVALATFTRTPGLWDCTPISVARAIVEAGQLGLEPTGLMGGAYLVPMRNECTLMIGYRGLVMLAMRSGKLARVEARVVHQQDGFEYEYGIEPRLRHVPALVPDPGPMVYAYAVAFYLDGGRQFDVMSREEIEAIRTRSRAGNSGPWVTDYEEMAKKTTLRRLSKLLPLTIEAQAALDEFDPEVAPTVSPLRQQQPDPTAALRAQVAERLDLPAPEEMIQLPADASPAQVASIQQGATTPQMVDAGSQPGVVVDAQAPAEEAPTAPMFDDVCGAPSPDGSAACVEAAGHVSPHRSQGGSWVWPAA